MTLMSMTRVWTISNGLSVLRIPLACLFLVDSPFIRCWTIICAMVTDILDGYLARRYGQVSQIGAALDPLTDKFFTLVAMGVLFVEGKLLGWQMVTLVSRDIAVVLFGCYLYLSGNWSRYHLRAIWCGKITTALQFFVLMGLTLGFEVPFAAFGLLIILGFLSLLELFLVARASYR